MSDLHQILIRGLSYKNATFKLCPGNCMSCLKIEPGFGICIDPRTPLNIALKLIYVNRQEYLLNELKDFGLIKVDPQ